MINGVLAVTVTATDMKNRCLAKGSGLFYVTLKTLPRSDDQSLILRVMIANAGIFAVTLFPENAIFPDASFFSK